MKVVCFLLCIYLHNPNSSAIVYDYGNNPEYKLYAKCDHKNLIVNIYRNSHFEGNPLEVVYKASFYDTPKKTTREFYIKKTDHFLKDKTLSNYTLVEHSAKGKNLTYPFGWENDEILLKEIKENCILIIERNIHPI
jgi:hypothetical protein